MFRRKSDIVIKESIVHFSTVLAESFKPEKFHRTPSGSGAVFNRDQWKIKSYMGKMQIDPHMIKDKQFQRHEATSNHKYICANRINTNISTHHDGAVDTS